LFAAAGLALLTVTYLLFHRQLSQLFVSRYGASSGGPAMLSIFMPGGYVMQGSDALGWIRAQEAELREAAVTSLLTQGAVALCAVGLLAAALGWAVAGRMLAPLRLVTATARRIATAPAADRGLHERIALQGPGDEVKELAGAFDTMVERLDHAFNGQRRFVAHASDELRTPLMLNRALIERAMHRGTASPDVKQLGASLLEINARHERLISGLLLLARADHEVGDRSPVELADVVSHVVGQTAAEAEQAGVTVHESAFPAQTGGDAMLLERLVYNLVENGIRHNTGDGAGWVRVASRTLFDGGTEVEVSNSGPAVASYEIPALFKPFHRLGAERVITGRGVGLGLSIARSVARAHGGDVTAQPRQGGGLVVIVTLPRT
jgi:signal transduction histidine kinase